MCKLDHTDPTGIPAFLCRTCNPSLIPTPEKLAQAIEAERERNRAIAAAERLKRDLTRARNDLERLERRDPEPGSVSFKIAESLRRKVARLEQEAV